MKSEMDPQQGADDQQEAGQFHIVGVGASAGGLEALEDFFRAVPIECGLAFVIVQHLSPDFESHMEELLGRLTNLAVERVTDGVSIRPNTIYVIPAGMQMVIRGGCLWLTERSRERVLIHPIDTFFTTLAKEVGRLAIGVVLSGTGSDGSRGVVEIRQAGGLVFAQDVLTAKFDGMSASAQATGCVDLVLSPAYIAETIVRFAQQAMTRDELLSEMLIPSELDEQSAILQLLNRRTSLDFSQYKMGTVTRRIHRRMQLAHIEQLHDYTRLLLEDERELNQLYTDLLIGVTGFFRDPEAFEALRTNVLPQLLAAKRSEPTLRIWSAGCATGEEAYSLAILLDEEIRRQSVDLSFKIFASDAHPGSLHTASVGCYSTEAVKDLSSQRLTNYFSQTSGGYRVNRELRNTIVFAPHNIINDAPFIQMDLIVCRNMLIYLQPAAQKKALALFHFALKANGYLFLGASETPRELKDEFSEVDPRWRIYCKRRDVRLASSAQILANRRRSQLPHASLIVPSAKPQRVDHELVRVYDKLLQRHMARSILANEAGEMLHVFGGAERFLRPRTGRPSNNLLEMIHETLKPSLFSAWQHARSTRDVARSARVTWEALGESEAVTVSVEPLLDESEQSMNWLVGFTSSPIMDVPDRVAFATCDSSSDALIDGLHQELKHSQDNLQATVEEMEASNEELHAANEELMASNEELQSTNEELHSVNEELYTVNAEYQRRVEELALANDDMDNLLATTRVGVIFLDEGLYIRRFTPEIARLAQLTSQDIGRSMELFAQFLNYPTLLDDLNEVWKDQEPRELSVRDCQGTPYLMRILPYQSKDNTRGLVLTLIDISPLMDARSEIKLQNLAIETAVNGILITDPRLEDNPITYVNHGFLNLTGYDREEVMGRNCRFLQGPETDPRAVKEIGQALGKGEAIRISLINYRKDGSKFWNDLHISPVRDHSGEIVNFVGVQNDITDQMLAQIALREANEASQRANEAKNSFLATMSHELRTPMTAILGFADILRGESDDPAYLEKVDTIKRNGAYLLALLNDILDLSKIEAGKLRFEKERIDIRRVMGEVEALMSVRAADGDVPLRFETATQLPVEITADEVRIRQILVNLISNALKFTQRGEVVVGTVVSQLGAEPRLEISVRDTGIGISPKQMESLFQPFQQASNHATRQFGGTGLGLSISKRLAEGMGGDILVTSQLGQGSCFTLTLPLTAEEAQMTSEASQGSIAVQLTPSPYSPNRAYPIIDGKVLLADDRRDVWLVGKFFLEKCGAQVTIAENGRQAVEAIHSAQSAGEPYQVILMDMQMPVMNGREAIQRLRAEGCTTPIIALTADAMEGEREACIAMGCDEYLPKPIDGSRLTHLVAKMIGQ